MTDDGERPNGDTGATTQEPVDFSSRRQERERIRADAHASVHYFGVNGDWSDADELEAQARELVRVIRESAGEFGERVQLAVAHARDLWAESATLQAPIPDELHPDEPRARSLVRRWAKRDILVDPDLPAAMSIVSLQDAEIWRVEIRERGETRALVESTDPYTGARPQDQAPIQPVWDYTFPTLPDIEAGERRERLAGSEMLGACERCHGSGKQGCVHCAGKGFVTCQDCRGRGRLRCPTCRGRGRIADPAAERRARAAKSYFQVHAERMAQNAVERLADLSERLRQDYGAPLPPSAQWAPTAPASGETLPCPDCVNGTIACSCNEGKRVCLVCHGSEYEDCPACQGTGRVIRHKEVARRFDTRISSRVVPPSSVTGATHTTWVSDDMLKRVSGEIAWEGAAGELSGAAPSAIPPHVWQAARDLEQTSGASGTPDSSNQDERRVHWRRVALLRTPVTRLEYAYAGHAYAVVSAGAQGQERFWADRFPPRWHRVTRFFQAVARDLNGESVPGPRAHYTETHPDALRLPRSTDAQPTIPEPAPNPVNEESATPGAPTSQEETDL
jgi:hypothetical protein